MSEQGEIKRLVDEYNVTCKGMAKLLEDSDDGLDISEDLRSLVDLCNPVTEGTA